MANTRNTRVSTLLKSLGIDVMEASHRMKKQPITLYRIVNNENEASKGTLKSLADTFGANYDWLLTGKGEMMDPNPKGPLSNNSTGVENALNSIQEMFQEQLRKKDEQIAGLMALLQKVNFLNSLAETSYLTKLG